MSPSNGATMIDNNVDSSPIQWSGIDKWRFYGIGTLLYSSITLLLHPMTVLKTRDQVLSETSKRLFLNQRSRLSILFQPNYFPWIQHPVFRYKWRSLFQGVGIVLSLAVPARIIYLTVLETSREYISSQLNTTSRGKQGRIMEQPMIQTISTGIAGGLAGVCSQLIVVPMYVLSQKQMIMSPTVFRTHGGIWTVITNEIRTTQHGFWKPLYKGFGLSLLSSLPTGCSWWAVYGLCQHSLRDTLFGRESRDRSNTNQIVRSLMEKGIVQILSGISAGIVAGTMTQPFDVVRTRIQVGLMSDFSPGRHRTCLNSYRAVTRDVFHKFGLRGFYKGLTQRVAYISVWGTIVSAVYEYIKWMSLR